MTVSTIFFASSGFSAFERDPQNLRIVRIADDQCVAQPRFGSVDMLLNCGQPADYRLPHRSPQHHAAANQLFLSSLEDLEFVQRKLRLA